ncbi:MAG: type II toxin-antitoxin system VapC family toxin [Acidobacteriota bacterium]
MNVVDSSAWLEFFADSDRASHFEEVILDTEKLLVPVVCLYEVFKTVRRQFDETAALQSVAAMEQGRVVDLSASLSLRAAELSLEHSLPMADSLILATARSRDAVLWTQDADFEGIGGVRYFPKE